MFSDPNNFSKIYKESRKSARFKECIYPDHSQCTEKIIGAHSIQNNKILAKIADNGKVYMPMPKNGIISHTQTLYGRREATVFTGFCGFHDKVVFQPIEDQPFEGTEEQIFLYTYRAFSLEYHKKREALRMEQQLYSHKPSAIGIPGRMVKGKTGFNMAVNDFEEEKALFDEAVLNRNYDILTSIVWVFDGYSNFAATGGEAPDLDFNNKKIQDLMNPSKPVRHIYMSVFPEKDKTFVIIAWFKKFDTTFSSIKEKLNSLNDEEKRNYVNNTLPFITENIVIKPSSWDSMDNYAKEEFSMIFSGLPELLELNGQKFDRFKKPIFDLFSL